MRPDRQPDRPNSLLARVQRALYYHGVRRLPVGRRAAEVYACRRFRGLPSHVRAQRLYRLREIPRPHYYLGMRRAYELAAQAGLTRFSVAEFGVAEGSGLLYLQHIHRALRDHPTYGRIDVQIYGFDTFTGLPELSGAKDGVAMWQAEDFPADLKALQARIDPAVVTLVPGLFDETLPQIRTQFADAPLLFVSVDSDLYSSAKAIFDGLFPDHMPSVSYWYFDDVRLHHFSERVGELLAIDEFNSAPGNPFHFVPDYLAVRQEEPVPYAYTLKYLYYCIDDEGHARQQADRKSDAPQRLPLDPKNFTLFAE
ncbi:MAG: class I SAM-dependent methyltransferase [Chloroflexi bacterium]|nr:class I SAM-dependent methyltransferase [Chloroflexota bacterium]